MDAPLQDCTIKEQSGIVRFLWAEGVKPVEIHHCMLAQYGQSTMSQRKVCEWVKRFKSGQTRVTDEGHSGQPSTSRTQDHKCIVLQGDYVEKSCIKLLTVTSVKAVKYILPLLFDYPSYYR